MVKMFTQFKCRALEYTSINYCILELVLSASAASALKGLFIVYWWMDQRIFAYKWLRLAYRTKM